MDRDLGTLSLEGGVLRFQSATEGHRALPLASIRVIGECTNPLGPFADDSFLCVASDNTCWYEAAVYAAGTDEALEKLRRQLGDPFKLGLAGSTDYNSRVAWPPHLAEHTLFRYDEIPPSTWIGRAMRLVLGPLSNRQHFTEEVATYLAR